MPLSTPATVPSVLPSLFPLPASPPSFLVPILSAAASAPVLSAAASVPAFLLVIPAAAPVPALLIDHPWFLHCAKIGACHEGGWAGNRLGRQIEGPQNQTSQICLKLCIE
eukprot:1159708-Pelagomonas_calceolata.AAC.1